MVYVLIAYDYDDWFPIAAFLDEETANKALEYAKSKHKVLPVRYPALKEHDLKAEWTKQCPAYGIQQVELKDLTNLEEFVTMKLMGEYRDRLGHSNEDF